MVKEFQQLGFFWRQNKNIPSFGTCCWWFRNPAVPPVGMTNIYYTIIYDGFHTCWVVGNGISEPSTVSLAQICDQNSLGERLRFLCEKKNAIHQVLTRKLLDPQCDKIPRHVWWSVVLSILFTFGCSKDVCLIGLIIYSICFPVSMLWQESWHQSRSAFREGLWTMRVHCRVTWIEFEGERWPYLKLYVYRLCAWNGPHCSTDLLQFRVSCVATLGLDQFHDPKQHWQLSIRMYWE